MQLAPQTVDKLQNAAGFGLHDRLHHQLAKAKSNESLGQIGLGVKKEPTPAEKTAAKLRNRVGERAYVTDRNGSWGQMGALIADVKDDVLTCSFQQA